MQEKWDKKWSVRPDRPGSATPSQSLPPLPTALFWDISRTGSGKKPTDLGTSADHEMSELK